MAETIISVVCLIITGVLYIVSKVIESNTFISDRRKRYIRPPAANKKMHKGH